MKKRAAFELSVTFLVILIICIVIFSLSVHMIKKFFTHAETIKMTYDEKTEKEIERLLYDGSRVAVPFDKKTIYNGKSDTFGIGILNMLNTGPNNDFKINVSFNKAFDRRNELICSASELGRPPSLCGFPNTWLQTTTGMGGESGVSIIKRIKNNEQERFLLGVNVKNALSGTYIFDLDVRYENTTLWVSYDVLHKLYVEVP